MRKVTLRVEIPALGIDSRICLNEGETSGDILSGSKITVEDISVELPALSLEFNPIGTDEFEEPNIILK